MELQNAPKLIVNPSFCNVLTVVAVAIRGRLSRSICPKRLFVNDYEVINQYIIDLENNVVICNPCHPTHSASVRDSTTGGTGEIDVIENGFNHC